MKCGRFATMLGRYKCFMHLMYRFFLQPPSSHNLHTILNWHSLACAQNEAHSTSMQAPRKARSSALIITFYPWELIKDWRTLSENLIQIGWQAYREEAYTVMFTMNGASRHITSKLSLCQLRKRQRVVA
jgi:hypothetical protein